jgi:hypothetical protein
MARMSREFSLVLLGAGLLTAGFFLPESDPAQKAADEATGNDKPAPATSDSSDGSNNSVRRRRAGGYIILFHTASARPNRPFGTSSTVRGGFGRSGGRFVGG